jgi:hypothetical protein
LKEKETKSSRGFDAILSLVRSFPSDESPVARVYYSKVFNSVTPLRAIIRFMEALNFSLRVFSSLVLLLVKNEALEQFLKLEEVTFDPGSDVTDFS